MQLVNGKVILGNTDCFHCNNHGKPGYVYGSKPCTECNGTGRGKRGKARGCKECIGYRTMTDTTKYVVCGRCKGSAIEAETTNDTVPAQWVLDLPITIVRSNRQQTTIEYLLGVGLFSCTDYGRHTHQTDDELRASIFTNKPWVQLSKLIQSRDDLTFAKRLVVACNNNGYSVIAAFS